MIGKLEMFIRECKVQFQGLDGLQELRIIYEDIEVKQKTSLIGIVFVKI